MRNALFDKIENILTSEYSVANYVTLVQEIFDNMKLVAPDKFRKEFTNFSSHIEGSTHVGNYTTPDNKKIIIFSVKLLKRTYVEGSRSTQRSYAKKLIENANADAAMIAFYTEGDPKWRLSFVRLDYEMKFENGKLKTAENMTPAKRYSFLVGKDEPCHTAIDRFRRFISEHNFHPTIDELEEAFSVEAVTNEFFNLYCEKFKQLLIHLEDNQDFVIEAEQHNFTAAQFAKKLMGQIVFLYFLQKKGWLGVGAWPTIMDEKEYKNAFFARGAKSRELIPLVYLPVGDGTYKVSSRGLNKLSDEDEAVLAQCVKGKPWGSGPHNFMRKLFEIAQNKNQNFFDDYLEPLFYDALNVNRGEQGYDPALHCRIPFLSGGLFEPIDGYDWKHNDFAIPNEVFSNRINNNPRTGDGILDIFDRYNFTMSEDEPMEREVAIDPEMLGKVFENLLEVNDRKAKGAFYTPREIVHYMCQESLINYLTNTLQIPENDIRDFILYGDFMKDEDTEKTLRVADNNGSSHMEFDFQKDLFISENILSFKKGVNRLADLDKALADVRVADPAVGSGAFPLGMLNEIVRARQNISAYMAITMKPYDIRLMYSNERSPHTLKYETIRNSIFAADLEPSAVDIAQLRLWLALVIDDEINPNATNVLEGHRNPLPLPNLECNIVCGNSLIDQFEGVPLINHSALIGTEHDNQQMNLYQSGFDAILPTFIEEQDKLFRCTDTSKKQELLASIASLKDMIIASQMQGRMSDEMEERYEQSKKEASKPFVLWQLDFARVFREKGGFDIVIGNPPYIQLQKSISETSDLKLGDLYVKQNFETFAKTGDIYGLFYEKGWSLLHKKGVLSFITSNKWMRAGYGKALRGFFATKTNPIQLIDFAGQKIFESATVDVNILIFEKAENEGKTLACLPTEECRENLSVFVQQAGSQLSFFTNDSWIVLSSTEHDIKEKIESIGTPLKDWDISINYGIKTGFNDAFVITSDIKDQLINEDPKSAELIRPILRGRDIKRYKCSFADLWLIYVPWHFPLENDASIKGASVEAELLFKEQYPAVYKHLLNHKEKLSKRNRAETGIRYEWYALQRWGAKYKDDFSKQKIVWGNLCLSAQFALAEEGTYINAPSPMIVPGNKYILAILNSKLGDWYIRQLGVTRNGGYFEYKPMFVEKLPVPIISESDQMPFVLLVDSLLDQKSKNLDITEIENKIDDLVFKLYGLSDREIAYITQ